jgi:hypothetical protein
LKFFTPKNCTSGEHFLDDDELLDWRQVLSAMGFRPRPSVCCASGDAVLTACSFG